MVRRYNCLTSGQRAAVEQMALRGCSNGAVADTLDIDKSKVAKIGARVRRQGHVGRLSRTGRPPILDRRCLQRLKRLVRGGRYSSLRELTSSWNSGGYKQVSTKTLRRCIHKLGFSSLKPVTKPFVGPINRCKRRRWAREHRGWSNEWNKVLFTGLFHRCIPNRAYTRRSRTADAEYYGDESKGHRQRQDSSLHHWQG